MSASERAPGWRVLLWPAVATALALAILVGLGVWQLERKAWKESLIGAIETRAKAAPAPLPPAAAWPTWTAATDEFRRVRASGHFVPGATVMVHGLFEVRRGQTLQGFYAFSPFRLDEGGTVFVNRGFTPTELRETTRQAADMDTAPATIVGITRKPEARGAFVPANRPLAGEWFVRDTDEMARHLLIGDAAPFYIALLSAPPGQEPDLRQAIPSLPNNHFGYALTWFGLALTLVGVFGAFAWRQLHPAKSGHELQAKDAGDDQAYAGEPQGRRRVAE